MGIFIDVGTRDETNKTSGSLFALKNTFMHSLKSTSRATNNGVIRMTAGECFMDYDQESIYYKANCFEYDVSDVFKVLVDLAFKSPSISTDNVNYDYVKIEFVRY